MGDRLKLLRGGVVTLRPLFGDFVVVAGARFSEKGI